MAMMRNTFPVSSTIARQAQATAVTQTPATAATAFRPIQSPGYRPTDMMRAFSRPFHNKVGLGIESADSIDFFLKHRLSTAMNGTLKRMGKFPEKYSRELDVFQRDFEKARGYPIPREHLANLDKCGMPWQIFKQASQTILLKESNEPYVKYYREAMETAFARGGEVYFYLGGTFESQRYVEDIINTEAREGKPFEDYIDVVPYSTLAELHKATGTHGTINPAHGTKPAMPGITNIEIYDLTVGSYRQHRDKVQYYSHDGAKLSTGEFLERHDELLSIALIEENRQRVLAGKSMTPEARHAVNGFQRHISGTGNLEVRGLRGAWRSEV
jgi:hypothetical protein